MPEPEEVQPDEREVKLKKLIKETLKEVVEERAAEKDKNKKHWLDSLLD